MEKLHGYDALSSPETTGGGGGRTEDRQRSFYCLSRRSEADDSRLGGTLRDFRAAEETHHSRLYCWNAGPLRTVSTEGNFWSDGSTGWVWCLNSRVNRPQLC